MAAAAASPCGCPSGVQGACLIAAGGISYTVGGAIYAFRRPNPWPDIFGYHELFHCATLIASLFHFTAVPPPPSSLPLSSLRATRSVMCFQRRCGEMYEMYVCSKQFMCMGGACAECVFRDFKKILSSSRAELSTLPCASSLIHLLIGRCTHSYREVALLSSVACCS